MKHNQVYVKVNAAVDEGIASLINELSRYPFIETTDSCQGAIGGEKARIYFGCGNALQAEMFISKRLCPFIYKEFGRDISITWLSSSGDSPIIEMKLPPELIEKLSQLLNRNYPLP